MNNLAISKSRCIRWLVVAIILLYISTLVDSIISLYVVAGFISNGQNIWTRYLRATKDHNILGSVGIGTTGIICNILADSAMVCAQ